MFIAHELYAERTSSIISFVGPLYPIRPSSKPGWSQSFPAAGVLRLVEFARH